MKILLVVPMVPQAEGAGAIPELLHAELIGLLERNEVTVIGTYGDLRGQAEAAAELGRAGLDVHFADRRPADSAARRWRVRGELALGWAAGRRPWRAVSTAAGLQPLLDRLGGRRFDVVAVEDTPVGTLRLPAGVPAVVTEHEAAKAAAAPLGTALREGPAAALRSLDQRRWPGFQRRVWRRFDLIQVFSEADAAAVRERAPGEAAKLRVNPFGLVLPPAAPPAAEAPGLLLFVGTFTHRPNVEAALWLGRELLPRLRELAPGARLRIVGTVPPPEVLALAGADVEVVADAASVRPHLEAASVVMAPVRSGGGMRMKVLQAMAAGRAVVTTPLGAEGFTALDPEPPFVVAESAAEIAAATAALLGDDSGRRGLGARAREFAERHHSPAPWAARLEALYAEAGRG